jgi:hypothetical protein
MLIPQNATITTQFNKYLLSPYIIIYVKHSDTDLSQGKLQVLLFGETRNPRVNIRSGQLI